jgi:hypothetical protein
MRVRTLLVIGALLSAWLIADVAAQPVYRCKQADGSIEFSDLPCESDIGESDVVDATHHQGAAPPPSEASTPTRLPPQMRDDQQPGGSAADGTTQPPGRSAFDSELSRSERQSLEVERNRLLSDLKRRHISAERRRELIRELRRTDHELGVQPGSVGDMPYHDRDVYDENRVYPGTSKRNGRRRDDDG